MNMEQRVTNLVCATLSEEDAVEYKNLMAKPPDSLSQEEINFLREKEETALTKSLQKKALFEEPPTCTCNAGWSSHRQYCELYGKPSLAQQFTNILNVPK